MTIAESMADCRIVFGSMKKIGIRKTEFPSRPLSFNKLAVNISAQPKNTIKARSLNSDPSVLFSAKTMQRNDAPRSHRSSFRRLSFKTQRNRFCIFNCYGF